MAENPTVEDGISDNGVLPTPDLPSLSSVDGAGGSSFISLELTTSHIDIRRQEIHLARTVNMVLPRSDSESAHNIHSGVMQNVHGANGTSHLFMHEIRDSSGFHLRSENNAENYAYRLRTFRNWPRWFLDPSVLAEANFCYTGYGDTVRCTVCGGELSNWTPGDDPRQEHMHKFGFSCC